MVEIDYTLFDCKSPASHISELMRPGMHSYLVSGFSSFVRAYKSKLSTVTDRWGSSSIYIRHRHTSITISSFGVKQGKLLVPCIQAISPFFSKPISSWRTLEAKVTELGILVSKLTCSGRREIDSQCNPPFLATVSSRLQNSIWWVRVFVSYL